MESNQKAADGTVYDNGYGICLIPQTQLTTANWSGAGLTGAYKSSAMHNSHLPGIVTKLQNVLGSHIVTRNVLLSSSVGGDSYSGGYDWTTAKATLMSIGQMTGTFAENRNEYDDGEANYKLPIFKFKHFATGSDFWSRGIWGRRPAAINLSYVWRVGSDGGIDGELPREELGVRPLIYLR